MYSNNIVNFQESITILNACTKKGWKRIEFTTHTHTHTHTYIYIYIYIYIYTNFVEHNGHFLSTYSLVDPFISPY